MFNLDQFVADCRAALGENVPQRAVQEVVARAVSTPGALLKTLGEPKRAEMQTLYRSDDLTILNVIWAPWMNLLRTITRCGPSSDCTPAAKTISSGGVCQEAMVW